MKNIRWILFDLGNVLYDINVENTFNKILSFSESTVINNNQIKEISNLHKTAMAGKFEGDEFFENLIKNFKLSISIEEIKNIWNEIIVGFREEFRPLLNMLKTKYNIGLLSNTDPFHYSKILNQEPEFNAFFDRLFLSHDIKIIKPNIEIYKYVLEQLDHQPEQILFFDDSDENIKSAKKAGINAFCTNNFDSVLTILKEYHIFDS